MKTNILYVENSKFVTVLDELNVPFTVQSGFLRVEGPKGRRLYVAATKKVGRVDISGFEVEFGAKVPHCGVFGKVKQQMDLSPELTEEGILENFRAIVTHMLQLQPVEKAPAKPKAPKAAKGTKVSMAVPATPAVDSLEAKLARIELIKRVAAEKGVAVASSTLALASE